MTRLMTLSLLVGFFAIAIAPMASARDDGGFSSSDVTDQSYSAFEDPEPFDPSSVEPAAGDETTDQNVTDEKKEAPSASKDSVGEETEKE